MINLSTSKGHIFYMKKRGSHETIKHDGTVKKADNNSVQVAIVSATACSGCHAEGMCSMAGRTDKLIEVKGRYNVSPGDRVTVVMDLSNGYRAVVLGYLIPLLIVVASLMIFTMLAFGELVSALFAILILVPYFLILYLFRDRVNRNFNFTLKT